MSSPYSPLELDVRVISLDSNYCTQELRALFPHAAVSVQVGVDLRKSSPVALYHAGIVGPSALTTIMMGRKWHWELSSKGGVGLAHANRLALSKGHEPLLLLEEDYNIRNLSQFVDEVALLHAHQEEFDMAIFGATYHGRIADLTAVTFMPPGWYYMDRDTFWCTHCVLYSANGRVRTLGHLLGPIDMQIDGLYSLLAQTSMLRVIVQAKHHTVTQKSHPSEIQDDRCILCDMDPQKKGNMAAYIALVAINLALIVVVYSCIRTRHS